VLLFGSPRVARATPDFPGVVVSTLGLSGITIDPPQGCTLCHTTNLGGTSLRPFGELLLQDGTQPYNESSLKQALAELMASDPKLTEDIKEGRDPNDDVSTGTVYTPEYGCSVAGGGGPPFGAWPTLIAAGLLFARRRSRWVAAGPLAVAAVALAGPPACSAPGAGPPVTTNPSPCHPQAPLSTSLGTILGVGRDARGVFYVADQDPTSANLGRVFVSDGGVLQRRQVVASLERVSAEGASYELTFDQPGAPSGERLLVATQAGVATSMALGGAGSSESPLAVVAPSTVTNLPVLDLPSAIAFIGDVQGGGDEVVVFQTLDDTGASAVQVFFGAPPELVEYAITGSNPSVHPGGSLSFAVQSETYSLRIGAGRPSDGGPESAGDTLLEGAGKPKSVDPRPATSASLHGLSFHCLGS
jgi:MYXO-CTERM domain-containing protein